MSSKLVIETQGHLVVLIHPDLPHEDQDWTTLMDLARRLDLSKAKALSFGCGLATSAQREELLRVIGSHRPLIAMMTDARLSRGVVTAVSWFIPSIKAFSATKRAEAFLHLGLTHPEQDMMTAMEKRLRARIAWSEAEQRTC